MSYKGKYTPKNYQKYLGDSSNIIYRSNWERRLMVNFDINPSVLGWNSEEVIIPYWYPVDHKFHRYLMDFYVTYKKKDGTIAEVLIEVKPKKYTIPPKLPKNGKKTRRFYQESYNFAKNSCKWKAAKKFAKERGWGFKILTEKDIF